MDRLVTKEVVAVRAGRARRQVPIQETEGRWIDGPYGRAEAKVRSFPIAPPAACDRQRNIAVNSR